MQVIVDFFIAGVADICGSGSELAEGFALGVGDELGVGTTADAS